MKAVVWYKEAKNCIEVREIEKPKPGPGEALLEVKAAAICGTELHAQDGETNVPTKFPVVLGHEYSGVVVELGPGVKGFSTGDRVVGRLRRRLAVSVPSVARGSTTSAGNG